jgi:hypothetical protein
MSNDQREADLFDEMRLRRALRLDAAELPARIDIAGIAAQAESTRPAFVAASIMSTVVAGLAAAGLLSLALVAMPAVAPTLASDLFADAIQALARAAIPASGLLSLAAQPTVPIAALAALVVAIAYEFSQRKERVVEVTS